MRILSGISLLALGLLTILPAQAQTHTYIMDGKNFQNDIKAELSITSLKSNQVTFTFKNVSTIKSDLTGIGFDLDGGTFDKTADPDDPFIFVDGDDDVPGFNKDAELDFYLAVGGDFNGGGKPQPGLSSGTQSLTYTILSTTGFAGFTPDKLASGVYFRFRSIGGKGQDSDVAHNISSSVVSAVPEPGEYAFGGMFLAGLVGMMVRARRKSAISIAS